MRTAAPDVPWNQSASTERDPLLQGRSVTVSATHGAGADETGHATDPDSDGTMQPTPDVVQPSRKFIIEPAALLICAGILSQSSIVTQYLYYRVGQRYNATINSTRAFVCNASALANETEHQMTSRIQSEASEWILYRNLVSGAFALVLMPIFASSSDYLGRRPALLIPCAGLTLDSLGLLLVMLLDLPLYWLVVSGGAGALGGGIGAAFAGMFAYLADTTSLRERPVRVAIVEGTFGVAGAVMELAVGWWIRLTGYATPMVISGSLTLANLLYVAFLVPEVRVRRLRGKTPPSRGGAGAPLMAVLSPFVNIAGLFGTDGRLGVTLGLLLTALGLYSASFIGISIVSSLYQMNYPFCLDSVFIGYLNAAKIVCFQAGVLLGLTLLRRCLGVKPLGLVIVGLSSAIASSLATGGARSTSVLFVAAAVGLFSMLPIPMLRAYTSQIAPASRQGALFSCIGVMEVAGTLAGSAAFTTVYSNSQAWMPGFVYLAVACTSLCALALTCACAIINCCCQKPKKHGGNDAAADASAADGHETSDARAVNYDT